MTRRRARVARGSPATLARTVSATRVDPEGPEGLARGGHHGQDEQEGGGQLALGPGAVQRARPREVERVAVAGPHGQGARVGSEPLPGPDPDRLPLSRANSPSPTPKVISTPISPERPVLSRSLSTPLTA